MEAKQIEKNSEGFNIEDYLKAREQTKSLLVDFASRLRPGIIEDQAHELFKHELSRYGVSKLWHPTKIRFGKNTLKSFKEKSEPNTALGEDDIFFIDIGPVFGNYEGDYGRTFVLGENKEKHKIANAVEEIFLLVQKKWKEAGSTGEELYLYASEVTASMGYELSLKMDGHLLGEFPHTLKYKGSLAEVNFTPTENLWVLEILIQHRVLPFGAFYEDVLI